MEVAKGDRSVDESVISVRPLGDRAFTIQWNIPLEEGRLAATAQAIGLLDVAWLQETVASYSSITFYMRGSELSIRDAARDMAGVLDRLEQRTLPPQRLVEIPVVYGGEHGPDLAECASRSGLSEQQFAELHAEGTYVVAMMGFAPGFPYLTGLHERLAQPRHDVPRLKVSAGSVGIAGNQTGIYPVDSPGGWQLIGRTSIELFRRQEGGEPFLLRQGDTVKFVPVKATSSMTSERVPAPAWSGTGSSVPVLRVLKPGMMSTVQDLGRKGWQSCGVSVGGAMDEVSMRMANALIGNDEGAAVLELTLIGGDYGIERDALVSICGADLDAAADGTRIPMNRPVYLRRGTTLSFGSALSGCRAYLAIAGGIDVPMWLGSRSADTRARMGGGFGRALLADDCISVLPPSKHAAAIQERLRRKAEEGTARWSSVAWSAASRSDRVVRASSAQRARQPRAIALRLLAGAEWNDFTSEAHEALLSAPYRVEASSDRMGIRLTGEALTKEFRNELQSHGVVAGTIQVPPNGQPIILAAGYQPTGGYPKIAHVISADMPKLAQAVPGDRLTFELVDAGIAERALSERERDLAILRAGMLSKYVY
ncbi:5-oxoprolinase subunit PxpB [Cohnella cholangitidis]|uniref:5-oxoprolinase subunit PxpB n=1 Tax=Cohnella cholangitidis TaxID=2598458 RepID=A0A7G5C2L6_9BACL|nr:5-oxoprolinase subunit PxpB [Cohnella cholangitidis]QMV43450.1 5-oxoprolinase subunit PxpB [Cohnella cholangitidis]